VTTFIVMGKSNVVRGAKPRRARHENHLPDELCLLCRRQLR
jgi:hypothetical protein